MNISARAKGRDGAVPVTTTPFLNEYQLDLLRKTFEEHANYNILDEELLEVLEETVEGYFRAFRPEVRLQVCSHTTLHDFIPFSSIDWTTTNSPGGPEYGKADERANVEEDPSEDEDASENSSNGWSQKAKRDYFFVIDGTVEAISKKGKLSLITPFEDSGKLYMTAELNQRDSVDTFEVVAGKSGAMVLHMAYLEYVQLLPNDVHESSARIGTAELSRRLQLLRQNPLFRPWDNRKLSQLARALNEIDVLPFQNISEQGGVFKECFVISRGEVHLRKTELIAATEIKSKRGMCIRSSDTTPSHTTLAILGPSHIGNVVEMVEAQETGRDAQHRATVLAGPMGAKIYTISHYMADIFLLSNKRQWNILNALRCRRLLWDSLRVNLLHTHPDISVQLQNTSTMVNVGYVLAVGSVAQSSNGAPIVEHGSSGRASFVYGDHVLSEYQLTIESARSMRRAGEALAREREYAAAISPLLLAADVYRSAVNLIPCGLAEEKKKVATHVIKDLESMTRAFAALESFFVRDQVANVAIKECQTHFTRQTYNKATKAFIQAHETWKSFLQLRGEENPQYVELNKQYARGKQLTSALVVAMTALTKQAVHSDKKDCTRKMPRDKTDQASRKPFLRRGIHIDGKPFTPAQQLGRSATGQSGSGEVCCILSDDEVDAGNQTHKNDSEMLVLMKKIKQYGVTGKSQKRFAGHSLLSPKRPLGPQHPNHRLSPRQAHGLPTFPKTYCKSTVRGHPDALHQTKHLTPTSVKSDRDDALGPESTSDKENVFQSSFNNGVSLEMCNSISMFLVEPNENAAQSAGYMLSAEARKYGLTCSFDSVCSGKAALKKLFPRDPDSESKGVVPTKGVTLYTAIIISAGILDVSWRTLLEKVRKKCCKLVYVVGHSQTTSYISAMKKDIAKYGGHGFYPKPYNHRMASNIISNIEKYGYSGQT